MWAVKKVEIFLSIQQDHVVVGISFYSHVFLIQKSNCAEPEYVMMIAALVCSLEPKQLNCGLTTFASYICCAKLEFVL